MKLFFTLLTLIFSISLHAETFELSQPQDIYQQKISENSFTVIKNFQVIHIKTTQAGMTQTTIDMESGLVKYFKTEGTSLIEKELWLAEDKLFDIDFELFSTTQVLVSNEHGYFEKMLCNAERQALLDAIDALQSAVASGNPDLIVHAEALYFAAATNYHKCLTRPVTHEK